MKQQQFTIKIKSSRQKVWDTLWQDATFREWAGLIDPGTNMVGELALGNEIQFIAANGYGVTSRVEAIVAPELLILSHQADTKENGSLERDKEWTGGQERYQLTKSNDHTILDVIFDVPPELEAYFTANYPKALERVKSLAERS